MDWGPASWEVVTHQVQMGRRQENLLVSFASTHDFFIKLPLS